MGGFSCECELKTWLSLLVICCYSVILVDYFHINHWVQSFNTNQRLSSQKENSYINIYIYI